MFYTMFNGGLNVPINIQVMQSGNWITITSCPDETPVIQSEMAKAATLYPGSRIRAVDDGGRLVDILT